MELVERMLGRVDGEIVAVAKAGVRVGIMAVGVGAK